MPQHIGNDILGDYGHQPTEILKKPSYNVVLWAELYPLKRYAEALIPGT